MDQSRIEARPQLIATLFAPCKACGEPVRDGKQTTCQKCGTPVTVLETRKVDAAVTLPLAARICFRIAVGLRALAKLLRS